MRRLLLAAGALAVLAPAFPVAASAGPADDRWALVIGIDRFQGRTRPNVGAAGDAMDMRNLLLRHGWRSDHVRVLTDGAATAAGIRSALGWLVSVSGPRSTSVFHYSGHVKQLRGDGDRDGEALDEYLWPHDNRFISDGELAGYLRRLQGTAWISISGCEAAGFDEGISSRRRLFTASSRETEKSYEYPDWRNSVWTGLLVDQGMLRAGADADRDGHVTLDEAFAHAAPRATEMTRGQRMGPQHPFRAGGQDVRWFPPPPAPPPAPGPEPPRTCVGPVCL